MSLHRVFGLFDFRQPFFFVRDPEILKQLGVKDFDHFENHRSFIDEDVDLLFVSENFVYNERQIFNLW